MCIPGCGLETDEDDIDMPTDCPWRAAVNAPKWQAGEP